MAFINFGSYQSLASVAQGIWRNKERQGPVLFTASSIWLSVAQMASGIVIVHYVVPAEMGIWASVSLALVYSLFALIGIQNGLSRELPYYLGANDELMAKRLAATTLFYTGLSCITSLLGGACIVVWLLYKNRDPRLVLAVGAMSLMVTFQFYQYYLFLTFRSKNSFLKLAWVQTWQASIMLLTLPLLVMFHYYGMLLRAVLTAALALYLMHRVRPLIVRPSWDTASFWLLIKTGLPIFATDYVRIVSGTVDKLVLLRFVGVEQVGLYALAATTASAFQVLPQSIAHYVYPRMSHHYGRTNNPRVLWGIAYKVTLVVLAVMIPVAMIGYLLLPWGVKTLFPKYVAGTHAAQIMLFASVAWGATISSNALSSLKAWSHLIGFQFSSAALSALAPFVGIHLFRSSLNGVSYSLLIANSISVILALAFTYAATHTEVKSGDPSLGLASPPTPITPAELPDEIAMIE